MTNKLMFIERTTYHIIMTVLYPEDQPQIDSTELISKIVISQQTQNGFWVLLADLYLWMVEADRFLTDIHLHIYLILQFTCHN